MRKSWWLRCGAMLAAEGRGWLSRGESSENFTTTTALISAGQWRRSPGSSRFNFPWYFSAWGPSIQTEINLFFNQAWAAPGADSSFTSSWIDRQQFFISKAEASLRGGKKARGEEVRASPPGSNRFLLGSRPKWWKPWCRQRDVFALPKRVKKQSTLYPISLHRLVASRSFSCIPYIFEHSSFFLSLFLTSVK